MLVQLEQEEEHHLAEQGELLLVKQGVPLEHHRQLVVQGQMAAVVVVEMLGQLVQEHLVGMGAQEHFGLQLLAVRLVQVAAVEVAVQQVVQLVFTEEVLAALQLELLAHKELLYLLTTQQLSALLGMLTAQQT